MPTSDLPLPLAAAFFPFGSWSLAECLTHLWQSTLIALALLLVMVCCRPLSARTRLALGWMALAKFVIPFSLVASVAVFLGGDAARWLPSQTLPFSLRLPAFLSPAPAQDTAFASPPTAAATTTPASPGTSRSASPLTAPTAASASASSASPPTSFSLSPATALFLVWLAIFFLLAVAYLRRASRARRRLLAHAAAVPTTLAAPIADAAALAGLRHPPRCVTVAPHQGPALVGLVCPVVILPRDLDTLLTPAELRAVLLHEFIHLRQRDHVAAALRALCTGLLWFNPVAWLLHRRLRDETEKSCDERVVALTHDADTYATSILKVVRHNLGLDHTDPAVAAASTPPVVARVQNILSLPSRRPRYAAHFLAVTVGISLIALGRHAGLVVTATAAEPARAQPAAAALSAVGAASTVSAAPAPATPTPAAASSAPSAPVPTESDRRMVLTGFRADPGTSLLAATTPDFESMRIAIPAQVPGYRLRARDSILVHVTGEPDVSRGGMVRLSAQGTAMLPLLGEVDVGGKTLAEAQQLVRAGYARFATNPAVSIGVFEYAPGGPETQPTVETHEIVSSPPPRNPTAAAAISAPTVYSGATSLSRGSLRLEGGTLTLAPARNTYAGEVIVLQGKRSPAITPAIAAAAEVSTAPTPARKLESTLTVDFPATPVRDILRNVADVFELNLAMPDSLQGKATVKLDNATWRQIFDAALASTGHTYTVENNIIRVFARPQPAATGSVLTSLDVAPVPRTQARPIYPFELRRNGIEGLVVVDFIVDAEGTVTQALVHSSTQKEFEAAAIEAVRKWKYTPGQRDGRPVSAHLRDTISFQINQ